MRESIAKKKTRVNLIVKKLNKLFPRAEIALNYSNNWELLVAVILSAQCTDKKVNEVTEKLFRKYRILDDYVSANKITFENDIRQTGFYRNKTKHILASASLVKNKFSGKVPKTMDELLILPGVARKTANIVLGCGFGIVEGIAVDTHVKRLSRLLNLTNNTDPNKIEQDLMKLISKKDWLTFNLKLVLYGREYCPAKRHNHAKCPLSNI
jgi:endonuclease III